MAFVPFLPDGSTQKIGEPAFYGIYSYFDESGISLAGFLKSDA